MKVAIIFCCYNRKEMTKRCLLQLTSQMEQLKEYSFEIYVCDDGSSDGTTEMIEAEFAQVYLMKSGGNLYWCKSMYIAMKKAVEDGYDLYLMVNDDVDFADDALKQMLVSYREAGESCAVVGAVQATQSDRCTYGGRDENGKLVEPNGEITECDRANWNCFLVDSTVITKVGIIDGKYQHAWGDFDYSFRLKNAGIKLYLAKEYVGRCDVNTSRGTYRDSSIKRKERLKKLFGPKGMPFYSYMRYHIRVFGKKDIFKYCYGYLTLIGYIVLGKEIV